MSSTIGSIATAAHSAAVTLTAVSPIKPGDAIPSVAVKDENGNKITLHDVPGKILIVGVPAAFSPSCNNQVPGYIENLDKLQSKGVSQVYVLSVNDAFVIKAWKEKLSDGKTTSVHFLADDTGAYASKLGLVFDASELLGSPRAKRFVIVSEGGKVEKVIVEKDPPQVTVTSAETVLQQL